MVFNFFKRRKKEEELPIPDFPVSKEDKLPPLPGFDEELPPLPPLEEIEGSWEELELPPLPAMKKKEKEELPPLPKLRKEGLPTPPSIKSVEEIKRAVGEIKSAPIKLPVPKEVVYRPVPRRVEPIREIREAPQPVRRTGKVFIEVEKYKAVFSALSSIKGSIAKSNAALVKIEEIGKNEEQKLEKWQSALNIAQKKIINIDKNLFKEVK